MSEQRLGSNNNAPQIDSETPTGWISQVDDEELRRQELTWAHSEINKNSPEGKTLISLLRAEMQKRGITGYNLNPDDPQHLRQVLDAIKGTSK